MAASKSNRRWRPVVSSVLDLGVCAILVGVSLIGVYTRPNGDMLRMALVAPMLVFVPGYLLLEAWRSVRKPLGRRLSNTAVAPGLSLAFVALLALATALFPGGFRPDAIIAMVTLVCVGLLVSASYRRYLLFRAGVREQQTAATRRSSDASPKQARPASGTPRVVVASGAGERQRALHVALQEHRRRLETARESSVAEPSAKPDAIPTKAAASNVQDVGR